jgi:hypothetical protein
MNEQDLNHRNESDESCFKDLTKEELSSIVSHELRKSGLRNQYIRDFVDITQTTLRNMQNAENLKTMNRLRRFFHLMPSLKEKIFS